MGVFEDALRKRAPNSPEQSYLAPGWKWSVKEKGKVRKSGGTYMEIQGDTIYYQQGRNFKSGSPGGIRMKIPTYPYFYLIVLTHLETEMRRKVKELR